MATLPLPSVVFRSHCQKGNVPFFPEKYKHWKKMLKKYFFLIDKTDIRDILTVVGVGGLGAYTQFSPLHNYSSKIT